MRLRLAALAVLAALAAGCGGGGSSSSDPAKVVPGGALAYAVVNTDLGSSQLTSAKEILAKFPGEPKAFQSLLTQIDASGVDAKTFAASLGSQVAVAAIQSGTTIGAVGFAQPSDQQTFDSVLAKNPKLVHQTIDGWTVFSEQQALLDAVQNRSSDLSGDDAYQAAFKTLPGSGDAIGRAYVSGAGIKALGIKALQSAGSIGVSGLSIQSLATTPWIASALSSESGAFKLVVHEKEASAPSSEPPSLAGQIPSGAIVALSSGGTGASVPAAATSGLPSAIQTLLVPIDNLLNGPLIAYLRPGVPLPEVTIAAKPAHPAAVAAAVAQVLRGAAGGAKASLTKVNGGALFKITVGGSFALYYGTWNGEIVLTDSANALAELGGSSGKLSDDQVFKDATSASGMPDTNNGFLFADVSNLVPAIEGIAQLAGQQLPASVETNLKPLRSALVYGAHDGDVLNLVAYVATS